MQYQMQPTKTLEEGRRKKEGGGRKEGEGRRGKEGGGGRKERGGRISLVMATFCHPIPVRGMACETSSYTHRICFHSVLL